MPGNILGLLFESKCEIDAINAAVGGSVSGTDYIYNADTEISAATKVVSGGPDNLAVWFKIQEI